MAEMTHPMQGIGEIAFVDTSIADYRTLVEGIRDGVGVVLIDGSCEGLAQVAAALAGRRGIDAIHVFSHGAPGVLQLGSTRLDEAALRAHANDLAVLRAALDDDADLLVYGCEVGKGIEGARFLQAVSAATGANVAASVDPTGSALLGGTWELDAHVGTVAARSAIAAERQADFAGVLAIADEDFDSGGGLLQFGQVTQATYNGWKFTSTVAVDMGVLDETSGFGVLMQYDDGAGDGIMFLNYGGGSDGNPINARNFTMSSADGSDFKLESFRIGQYVGAGSTVTISAYRDGNLVVTGEPVDLTTSDSAGNIRYTLLGDDGYSRYGSLSFNGTSAYDQIDEIRFSFSNMTDLEVDDIDVSAAQDLTPPKVSAVYVPSSGAYTTGQTLSFTVAFDENLTVTGTDSTLGLTIGSVAHSATYASKTANTITYTYTVQAGDVDTDGIAVGALSPGTSTIRDAASNNADLTLHGVGSTTGVIVDTVAPAVSGTIGVPAAGSYKAGQTLSFTVKFSENVTVNGTTSTLGLTIGGVEHSATYASNTADSITYTYTVQAGDNDADGIAIGALSLGSTTIRDAAGNDANPSLAGHLPSTAAILVDTTAPALSGAIGAPADRTYAAGDALTFTVNFSEDVAVTGAASTLGLTIGSTARSASFVSADANSVTYRYIVQAGDADTDGVAITGLSLNGGTIRDAAGNDASLTLGGHLPPLGGVLVDARAPAVTGNVAVPANGSYGAGETLSFTVTFDENVTVAGTDSTLGLTIGSTARSATFAGSTANSMTYTYTVQAGDNDDNGIAVGGIALGTTTIRDAAGNDATVALPGHLPSTAGILVDTTEPAVVSVAVPANATYVAGQNLDFTVAFDENVVLTGSDSTLGLTVGSAARSATFLSSDGNNVTYRYTVQAGDVDADGITVGSLTLGTSTIRDAAGNAANPTLNSMGSTAGILIDATVPAVAGLVSVPGDGMYSVGDILSFTVTFDENLEVSNGAGTLDLDIGGTVRSAAFAAKTANSITYTYTIQDGDNDADGIAVTGMSLHGGTIRDAAGNNANLTLAGHLPSLAGVLVDGGPPSVAGNIAVPDNGSYRAGQVLSFTVTFDEAVTVAGNDSTLGLTIGNSARNATFASKTANSVTYTYTVQAGDTDANGIAVGGIAAGTTTIRDAAGNDAVLSLSGHLPSTAGILVDTTAPAVTGNVSVPANKTYVTGDQLDFTVSFDEDVTVTGSGNTLGLTIGSAARSATFLSSDGNTVTYRYTVQTGDVDADGIAVGAISLGAGSIRDAAGNNAVLSLANHLPVTSGVLVDGSVPAILGNIVGPANGTYAAGQTLTFTVTFTEDVDVGGTASTLGLDIGGTARDAVYTSKTADSITYTYTVEDGDNDADGIAVTGLALNGSTIRDSAGNDAVLALTGHLPTLEPVRVDTVGPAFTAATVSAGTLVLSYADASLLDNTHVPAGQSFTVVVAGEAVAVTGVTVDATAKTVTLTLEKGVTSGQAVTVAYDDPSSDNDVDAVQDVAGNDAASFGATPVTNNTPAPGTPPTTPTKPPSTNTTVDGVTLQTGTVVLSDGTVAQSITVPIVPPSRQEQVGNNNVADIPLVKAADGTSLLAVQVPTGAGLASIGTGVPRAAGDSLTDLIREIKAHTASGSFDQGQLTGGGGSFLDGLSGDTPLLVQTIVLSGSGGSAATPLGIIGQPQGAGAVQAALVIDARSLASGAALELQHVEFAAVIGAATVTGGTGSQHVWGDGASQTIILGADDDVLHGGAGADIVGSAGGNDMIYGDEGNDMIFGGEGDDYLDGGTGQDIARYAGAVDGFSLRVKDGLLVMTDLVGNEGTDTVAAVETLRFTGGQSMADEAVLARLYEGLLGRAASGAEVAYWQDVHGAGASMRDIAAAILGSAESTQSNGAPADADFVAGLYQAVLGRAAAASESAYWTGVLAGGADRATVALDFVNSAEKLSSSLDADFNHSDVAVLVRVYHAMFGRAPDEGGLNFWLASHDGGMSIGAIADAFTKSAEAGDDPSHAGDAAFIDQLYATALDRAPSADEKALLLDELQSGVFDRGQVLLNVAESAESIAIVGSVNTSIELV